MSYYDRLCQASLARGSTPKEGDPLIFPMTREEYEFLTEHVVGPDDPESMTFMTDFGVIRVVIEESV